MTKAVETMPPPQPLPDAVTKPYWDHAAKGELAVPQCQSCGGWQFPPIEFCRRCGSKDFAYKTLSGKGTVYTYLIEHHKVAPGFDDLLPYAIAIITPDEAPNVRLIGRIVDTPLDQIAIGKHAEAVFVDHPGGDFKITVWRLTV